LQDAFGVWQELSRSREETLAYESRLKYILDEEAKLGDARYFAKKEGIEEGLERGLEQGLEEGKLLEKEETARQLLAMRMDIDVVVKITKLDEKKILEIQQKIL